MMCGAGLPRESKYVKCLRFIHDEFFTDLETAMGGVVGALVMYEEKCKLFHVCDSSNDSIDSLSRIEAANDWLVTQKTEDFEKLCNRYISRVFPLIEMAGATASAPNPESNASLRESLLHHQRSFHFPNSSVCLS